MGFKLPEGWQFIGNGWVAVPDQAQTSPNFELAQACAKGSYQESLLDGEEAWSGSTLKGKAREWSSRYSKSRNALEKRLKAAGVVFSFQTINRRNVLCIGTLPKPPVPKPVAPEPEFSGVINNIADLLGAVS